MLVSIRKSNYAFPKGIVIEIIPRNIKCTLLLRMSENVYSSVKRNYTCTFGNVL